MPTPLLFPTRVANILPVQRRHASAIPLQSAISGRAAISSESECRSVFAVGSSSYSQADDPISSSLRHALNRGQFQLYYQPIVNASDRRTIGWEALIRWCTPDRGIVSPAEFIPDAERNGFITELSAWVLTEACRELAYRSDTLGIAVNISAVSLTDGHVVSIVAAALEASGLQPHRLTIELTESVGMALTSVVTFQMDTLAEMGVKLAIDDFGTGYSSLSYLHAIPFHWLKVDRSFAKKIACDAKTRVILQAIFDLAARLGVHSIAEGIETEEEAEIMIEMGATALQGYHFGRPLPAEAAFSTVSMF